MQASPAPAQVRINHSEKPTSYHSSYLFRTVAPASFRPIRGEDHGFSHQTTRWRSLVTFTVHRVLETSLTPWIMGKPFLTALREPNGEHLR